MKLCEVGQQICEVGQQIERKFGPILVWSDGDTTTLYWHIHGCEECARLQEEERLKYESHFGQ